MKVMARKPKLKQAVVVIHGMGEQVPMETVRGLTDAVWVKDDTLVPPKRREPSLNTVRDGNDIWSKPDSRNRSHELHRMTTESDIHGRRTDFYEFYWAHRIHGTTLDQVWSWITDLLLRNPTKRVPKNVFNVWIALWILTIILFAIIVALSAGIFQVVEQPAAITVLIAVLGLATTALVNWIKNTVLVKIFGDVVRYTKASPLNISRRQEIREKGVELLETLMGVNNSLDAPKAERSKNKREYDRIIVVSHSLGTIVAYDILSLAFARINRLVDKNMGGSAEAQIDALEKMISQRLDAGALDIDMFQQAQSAALENLQAIGSPWIVSDFITLGSPLTHAEFLISDDEKALTEAQAERRYPTCPPQMEHDLRTGENHFTYLPGKRAKVGIDTRVPHHAALFGFTRWTNIYSPRKWFIWGDIVSGPIGRHFGLCTTNNSSLESNKLSGIRDIPVLPPRDENNAVKKGFKIPFMTHTKYWNMEIGIAGKQGDTPHHISVLRKAINLLRSPDPWKKH